MASMHHNASAAIFSPSVARIAANTARDWSYVDSWLASLFPSGHSVPVFERNPTTLRILLSIAETNEAVDETRHLVAHGNGDLLQRLCGHETGYTTKGDSVASSHDPDHKIPSSMTELRADLLDSVERHFTPEGRVALDSLVSTAIQNGTVVPNTRTISLSFLELQTSLFEQIQITSRLDVLTRHIQQERQKVENLLAMLERYECNLPPGLAKSNLNLQRRIKTVAAQIEDIQDQEPDTVAVIIPQVGATGPSVQAVIQGEQDFLAILVHKKELEERIAAFQGLPSDPDKARDELDTLRRQLQNFISRRDQVFEGLVERESPVKKRR